MLHVCFGAGDPSQAVGIFTALPIPVMLRVSALIVIDCKSLKGDGIWDTNFVEIVRAKLIIVLRMALPI